MSRIIVQRQESGVNVGFWVKFERNFFHVSSPCPYSLLIFCLLKICKLVDFLPQDSCLSSRGLDLFNIQICAVCTLRDSSADKCLLELCWALSHCIILYIEDTCINYIYTYIYIYLYIYTHTINLKSHFPWLHDAYNLYNILLVFVYMNLVQRIR